MGEAAQVEEEVIHDVVLSVVHSFPLKVYK